jgi:hypothetical protein
MDYSNDLGITAEYFYDYRDLWLRIVKLEGLHFQFPILRDVSCNQGHQEVQVHPDQAFSSLFFDTFPAAEQRGQI